MSRLHASVPWWAPILCAFGAGAEVGHHRYLIALVWMLDMALFAWVASGERQS